MSDEREKLRSTRARETVSLPFLLLPRTPSSSLLSLPCADAQGWKATSLDNARKFRMKFTVADPVGSGDCSDLATFASRLRAVSTFGLRQMPASRKPPSRYTKFHEPIELALRFPVASSLSAIHYVRAVTMFVQLRRSVFVSGEARFVTWRAAEVRSAGCGADHPAKAETIRHPISCNWE